MRIVAPIRCQNQCLEVVGFGRSLNGIDLWVDPRYYAIMNIRLTLDKAGRIVIPKPLREELRLEPGDDLEMESSGEEITLRPVRGTGPLTKEHGVWVFRTGQPMRFCHGGDAAPDP
jgi:AbrB family looped-hinge helix DNA binding protein